MKIIYRNLISTISKFKVAWFANFAGITAALTAMMFVAMQISYEKNFDSCHKNADRIYNLCRNQDRPFNLIISRKHIETLGQISPKVEAYSAVFDLAQENYIEVENDNGDKHGFYETVIGIDSGYTKMFDFQLIRGDTKSLAVAGNGMICESKALKLFGTTDIIGRHITANDRWFINKDGIITITAVYKDFPSNTQTKNAIYYALNDLHKDNGYACNFLGWVMLSSPNDREEIEKLLNEEVKNEIWGVPYYLDPTSNVYYHNEQSDDFIKSGSATTTIMLSIIALIVFLIAAVNQTNFNIAQIPMRIKSINTQKVIGCSVRQLRWQLFIENIIICIFTWLAALLTVTLLNGTWLTSFLVPDDLSISHNFGVCLAVGLTAISIITVSNIYPITKLTSVNPADILKGSYGRSQSGRKLRYTLLVFQFFAAISFISIAVGIGLQIKHMKNANTIIDQNQIAVFKTNANFGAKFDLATQKLKENSSIEKVAISSQLLGGADTFTTNSATWRDNDLHFNDIYCAGDILEVFDITPREGRSFAGITSSQIKPYDQANDHIITQDLANYGINVGDSIHGGVIRGIIDSGIRITSYRMGTLPLVLTVSRPEECNFCYVRIAKGSDAKSVVKYIEKVVSEIIPEMPIEIEFYDKIFQRVYKKEIGTSSTTVFLAILAMLISIIGVFGMVTFDSEYQRNEIAIRRVLGATTQNIIAKINIKYLVMILIGLALSIPATIYVTTLWQANFVEKISLKTWAYLTIGFAIAVLSSAIVTFQSAKIIYANPIEGLKKE